MAGNVQNNFLVDNFTCPICLELLSDPVQTPCGHTFDRNCVQIALDMNQECPLCKDQNVSVASLVDNIVARNASEYLAHYQQELPNFQNVEEIESAEQLGVIERQALMGGINNVGHQRGQRVNNPQLLQRIKEACESCSTFSS